MATQEQKEMVLKSVHYWAYNRDRTGLTIPFLSAVSGLSPEEVLEAAKTESLPDPSIRLALSYCGEIHAPILRISTSHPGYGYSEAGNLNINAAYFPLGISKRVL